MTTKRIAILISLVALLLVAAPVYIWNEIQDPAATLPGLGTEQEESALAYEVVEDTPLVIVNFGDDYYLDTVERVFLMKQWPPGFAWEITGNWFRIGPQGTEFSADITSDLGPRVLFGVAADSRVTHVEIRRDGSTIQVHNVSGPGFIFPAGDVRYNDQVVFLDAEGSEIATVDLVQKTTRVLNG